MKKLSTLALAASVLAACSPAAPSAPAAAPEMQLAVYDVPAGAAREVRSALSYALQGSGKEDAAAFGRASLAPDGRLLVLAPAQVQQGVQSLVGQLASRPAVAPARVEMSYWFVVGERAPATESRGLEEIEPALAAVSKAQ